MNDTKPVWASKTMWGLAVTAICLVFSLCHKPLSDQQQTDLRNLVEVIGMILGIVLAGYGRMTATTQLGKPDPGDTQIKLPMVLLVVCLGAGCIMAVPGCQPNGSSATTQQSLSPEQQYQAAAVSYQTALQEMISLRQAGVIDDAAYRQIEPFRAAAWSYLTQMQTALNSGQTLSFSDLLNGFNNAIQSWAATQPKKKPASKSPG